MLENYRAELIFSSPKTENFFFGYFSKMQISGDNTKILAIKVPFFNRMIKKDDHLEIGFFTIKDEKFHVIDNTSAVNWQQGCKLEWIGPDFNSKVIYNKFINDKLVSIIYDISIGHAKQLDYPIYSVSHDGEKAVSVDFERHSYFRRGYSYDFENISHEKKSNIYEQECISFIDLKANKEKKIIFVKDMINYKHLSSMDNAIHYLEHVEINPAGSRFCFLHRWRLQDGGIYARFYTADLDGKNLFLLNDSGRMSHFSWRNDNEILAYGGLETRVNRLRKYKNLSKFLIKPFLPVYHKLFNSSSPISKAIRGDSYMIFKDLTTHIKIIAKSISEVDGHPSFSRANSNIFITDTYPLDINSNKAKLVLFDIQKDDYVTLQILNSISEFDDTAIRCDLHPRWSKDGKLISIDTMDDGLRSIYVYELIED